MSPRTTATLTIPSASAAGEVSLLEFQEQIYARMAEAREAAAGKTARADQYLLARSGERLFAIGAGAVHLILEVPEISPIALAPQAVVGLAQVEGDVYTVVDLALRAGARQATAVNYSSRIVCLQPDSTRGLALLVARIEDCVDAAEVPAGAYFVDVSTLDLMKR